MRKKKCEPIGTIDEMILHASLSGLGFMLGVFAPDEGDEYDKAGFKAAKSKIIKCMKRLSKTHIEADKAVLLAAVDYVCDKLLQKITEGERR